MIRFAYCHAYIIVTDLVHHAPDVLSPHQVSQRYIQKIDVSISVYKNNDPVYAGGQSFNAGTEQRRIVVATRIK